MCGVVWVSLGSLINSGSRLLAISDTPNALCRGITHLEISWILLLVTWSFGIQQWSARLMIPSTLMMMVMMMWQLTKVGRSSAGGHPPLKPQGLNRLCLRCHLGTRCGHHHCHSRVSSSFHIQVSRSRSQLTLSPLSFGNKIWWWRWWYRCHRLVSKSCIIIFYLLEQEPIIGTSCNLHTMMLIFFRLQAFI